MIRQSLAICGFGSVILQGCLLVWAALLAQNKAKGEEAVEGEREGEEGEDMDICVIPWLLLLFKLHLP